MAEALAQPNGEAEVRACRVSLLSTPSSMSSLGLSRWQLRCIIDGTTPKSSSSAGTDYRDSTKRFCEDVVEPSYALPLLICSYPSDHQTVSPHSNRRYTPSSAARPSVRPLLRQLVRPRASRHAERRIWREALEGVVPPRPDRDGGPRAQSLALAPRCARRGGAQPAAVREPQRERERGPARARPRG
jgi:hypothetical protein